MIIIGGSGHAKVVLDILLAQGAKIENIWDDFPKSPNLYGIPVVQMQSAGKASEQAFIAIGNNHFRKHISEKFDFEYVTAKHPLSVQSAFATIGEGSVLMANAVVNADVVVGKHCIINTSAVVEHDCRIGDFVHISPNAALAGNVTVCEGAHIGIGASVIQGITIGKWSTVGAGAVVIRNVPDFATVVGNPGRIINMKEPT